MLKSATEEETKLQNMWPYMQEGGRVEEIKIPGV